MTLAKTMARAAKRFAALTARKAADGDFSLQDIDQAIKELNDLQDALECAKAQIEAACEDAGGEDYRGDQSKRVRWYRRGANDRGSSSKKCGS